MPRVRECDSNRSITAAIKYGMSKSRLSASDLAKAVGCDRVTIQRRFNYPEKFTIEQLRAISAKIGIPVENLVIGKTE